MSAAAEDWLFAAAWVHVFEEDTGAGAVYRPDGGDIPLSRRPRRRFLLRRDGSASLYAPGADDRFTEQAATWTEDAGDLVVRPAAGAAFRIVDRAPQRLLIATPLR